jgi:DNA-binding MarR family transcriptional regulator
MAGRKKTDSQQQPNDAQQAGGGGGASGRFAYDGLERVIHERARLSIMSSLAAHPEGLLFNDLKDLCSLTDGNLSRHLQLLQESKLVEVWKGFKNNRPQTLVRLTDDGKRRFLEYVQELEQVVADAMAATGRAAPARLPLSKGFSPA